MSIYKYLDYRAFLKNEIERQQNERVKFTMTSLAEKAGIKIAYFSKCLSGTADFNADQLYLIGKNLNLSDDEIDYLLIMLDYARSYHHQKKSYVLKKLQKIQKEFLTTEKKIKTSQVGITLAEQFEYYQNPLLLIIHTAIGLKTFQKKIPSLASALGISLDTLHQALKKLIDLNIIEKKGDEYRAKISDLHLSPSSPLCQVHQTLMRQQIIQHHMSTEDKTDQYNLLITFSADEKAYQHIKDRFLNFLTDADKIIAAAPEENVYQIQFELFPWLKLT